MAFAVHARLPADHVCLVGPRSAHRQGTIEIALTRCTIKDTKFIRETPPEQLPRIVGAVVWTSREQMIEAPNLFHSSGTFASRRPPPPGSRNNWHG